MHEWRAAWPPPVAPGVVQVWQARLPLEREPDQGWLVPAERARAARYVFDADRRRYVLSRQALRLILGALTGMSPMEVPVVPDALGKPRLPPGGPELSLAHAADRALVAVADVAVGVDLELVRPLPDLEALAAQVLSPGERATWAGLAEDQRLAAFYRAWTRKEAVLKARGDGLACPPTRVEVGLASDMPEAATLDGATWAIADLVPAEGFAGALATAGTPGAISLNMLPGELFQLC